MTALDPDRAAWLLAQLNDLRHWLEESRSGDMEQLSHDRRALRAVVVEILESVTANRGIRP